MIDTNLYQKVKNQLCDEIFEGIYDDGDRLPSERELEEKFGISRVTIRKSLELLEREKLIIREVGRGTSVTLQNCGSSCDLDMIVLIAPARNPFFSKFIARFQNYAQTQNSLILYVEKPHTEELETCLYRLYKRGLRNAVIWLEDLQFNLKKLKCLRALGMNLVFFDSDKGLPFTDCVTLDNTLAIHTLYKELEAAGHRRIGYVGWDLNEVYSIQHRKKAYLENAGSYDYYLQLPWKQHQMCREFLAHLLTQDKMKLPDALICSDRESGELTVKAARAQNVKIKIAMVDELSKNKQDGVLMYKQNLTATVETIFRCLQAQSRKDPSWEAGFYPIKGNLLVGKAEK